MRLLRFLLAGTILLALPSLGRAQTVLTGDVYDGNGGPLTAGVYHLTSFNGIIVPLGKTLTVEAGAILKGFTVSTAIGVLGTLDVNGTSTNPVIFTSSADGTGVPAPGDWAGLLISGSGAASTLDWLEVRYGGGNFGTDNIVLNVGADIRMTNCTSLNSLGYGMRVVGDVRPTLDSCNFVGNGLQAINTLPLHSLPGLTNNTASGNGGDYILLSNHTVSSDVSVSTINIINGALYIPSNLIIDVGSKLTLERGVVIKFGASGLVANGTLDVNGTQGQPVILTSLSDDSAGGDTNNNGPSTGTPGDWVGLALQNSSDASTLDWCEIRYGASGFGGTNVNLDSDATFSDCTIRDSKQSGLIAQSTARPTVRRTAFVNNVQGAALLNSIHQVPNFSSNTSSGNGSSGVGYDAIELRAATVAGADVTIDKSNVFGGSIVLIPNLIVSVGTTLTLEQGVVIKTKASALIANANANLVMNGTLADPVVLTSLDDDSIGGDTNLNGSATVPAPGNWGGVFYSLNSAGRMDNVLVRYARDAVNSSSTTLQLDGIRAEYASQRGFFLGGLASGTRLCAWNCNQEGFYLTSNTFDLSRVSSVSNAGVGIRNISSHVGKVFDSIAWNNGGGNYLGFVQGELTYSNGDAALAGTDGNINSDPLFVDEPNGDLNLMPGSPSIDAGDPTSTLDPDGTRADQGAYPRNQCDPVVYCSAKTSNFCGIPQIASVGLPSASQASGFTVSASPALANRFGLLLHTDAGPTAVPFQGGFLCLSLPIRRSVPVSSGGTGNNCDGMFSLDVNAFAQGNLGGNPAVFLKTPGTQVHMQWWGRDTTTTGSYLSDAIAYLICQ